MAAIPTDSVLDYAEEVARNMGVDPSLAKSIILAENMGKNGRIPTSLNDDTMSSAGAYGVSQVMKDTHKGLRDQGYLAADHSLDTWKGQVEAGVAALKAKSKEHRTTNPVILAAAYNGGNNGARLAAAGDFENLPPETKEYLNKLRLADQHLSRGRNVGASQLRASDNSISGDGTSREPSIPDPSTARPSGPARITGVESLESSSLTPIDQNTPQGRASIALEKSVELNRTILENLIKQTTDSSEEAATRMRAAGEAMLVAGSAEGLAAEQAGAIQAANAGARERILQIANLDTRDANNRFSQLLAERQNLKTAREPLRADIDERMSVGFFDNPLQWLVNATVLPGRVNEYNAMARRENDNVRELDKIQSEVAAQETIDMGATADMYLKSGLAIKDGLVAKARAESEKLRASASGLIAQKVMSIASLRERMIHDQEMLEKWRIVMADKRDAGKLKADELEERADINRRLATVGSMIGRDGVSIQSLKNQGKDVQEMWMQRQGTLTLGDSFSEAFEFIRRFGDLNVMRTKGLGEFADMQKAFQNAADERANNIMNTWSEKHPELATKPPSMTLARQMATAEMEKEWYGQRDNNMYLASQTNPYRINHQKGAKVFENQSNPIFFMVQDAFKNKQIITDKILVGATEKLVLSGALKPQQAAQALSEYYRFMVEKNNTDRSPRLMGLEQQATYKVKPETSKIAVDLANPMQTENWLTRMVATKYAESQGHYNMDLERYEIVPNPSGIGSYMKYKDKKPTLEENFTNREQPVTGKIQR